MNYVCLHCIHHCMCVSPYTAGGLKLRLGDPLDQSLSPSAACFAALPGNDIIFVCGFWDNSFKCFNTDTGESHWLPNTLTSLTFLLRKCCLFSNGHKIESVFGGVANNFPFLIPQFPFSCSQDSVYRVCLVIGR